MNGFVRRLSRFPCSLLALSEIRSLTGCLNYARSARLKLLSRLETRKNYRKRLESLPNRMIVCSWSSLLTLKCSVSYWRITLLRAICVKTSLRWVILECRRDNLTTCLRSFPLKAIIILSLTTNYMDLVKLCLTWTCDFQLKSLPHDSARKTKHKKS